MEIRLLSENEIPEAKELWSIAFGDPQNFIDIYFQNKILPGNSPAIFDNGRLVCIVHLIPYKMDIRGVTVDTAYVVGVATLPEYRNQGLMARLLKESLKILKQRGICITHLYPFLHAFYERFGWATYTDMAQCRVKPKEMPGYSIKSEAKFSEIISLYEKAMLPYTGYLIRNEDDFAYRIMEFASDGGKTAFAFEDDILQAYAIYDDKDTNIQVLESAFLKQEALQALLKNICSHSGAKDAFIFYPTHIKIKNSAARETKPYAMARIADVELLLSKLPFKDADFILEIVDDYAEWNQGIFHAVYQQGKVQVTRTTEKPQITCDIRSFTQLIHGYKELSALERTGEVIIHEKGLKKSFISLFPIEETFVYEAY